MIRKHRAEAGIFKLGGEPIVDVRNANAHRNLRGRRLASMLSQLDVDAWSNRRPRLFENRDTALSFTLLDVASREPGPVQGDDFLLEARKEWRGIDKPMRRATLTASRPYEAGLAFGIDDEAPGCGARHSVERKVAAPFAQPLAHRVEFRR
jgi:hypothetical protein